MDSSNGYEKAAKEFIQIRGQKIDGIGAGKVRHWVSSLPRKSSILDLGCGTGIPITKVLIDQGMVVYGIDASQSLLNEFRKKFPTSSVENAAVESSLFFERKFDAIIAWGLIFLISEENQIKVLQKTARSLKDGGKFLFTAPAERTEWEDIMSKQRSISLGAKKYKQILFGSGLSLIEEFKDEAGNHYYSAVKSSINELK
jgi:cyclopropane fatty-acyl-phospholipid synthase-like methyltransferase